MTTCNSIYTVYSKDPNPDYTIGCLKEEIAELQSRIARLEEAGDNFIMWCGHRQECSITDQPVTPCDCGYEYHKNRWMEAKK